jgi:hypothetical protein
MFEHEPGKGTPGAVVAAAVAAVAAAAAAIVATAPEWGPVVVVALA